MKKSIFVPGDIITTLDRRLFYCILSVDEDNEKYETLTLNNVLFKDVFDKPISINKGNKEWVYFSHVHRIYAVIDISKI